MAEIHICTNIKYFLTESFLGSLRRPLTVHSDRIYTVDYTLTDSDGTMVLTLSPSSLLWVVWSLSLYRRVLHMGLKHYKFGLKTRSLTLQYMGVFHSQNPSVCCAGLYKHLNFMNQQKFFSFLH